MIAIDSNLLVYAHIMASPSHERARTVLADLVASGAPWAIPVHCLTEVFAIVTNPRIYRPASTTKQALVQIESWLASPTVTLLGEDAATWAIQCRLVAAAKIIGPAIHDARIAAVCIQHDVAELWTNDRDFSRFPELRTRNPLANPAPVRAGEKRARYRIERRGRPSTQASGS